MFTTIRSAILGVLFAGSLAVASTPAKASLLGDDITYSYLFPDGSTVLESFSPVVDAGAEVLVLGGLFSIDIAESSASVAFSDFIFLTGAVAFNGIELSGLDDDSGGALVDVVLSTTDIITPLQSRLSFSNSGSGSVRLNLAGLEFNDGSRIELQFAFAPPEQDPAGSVPEPGSLALLAAGLVAMGSCRRSKQSLPAS